MVLSEPADPGQFFIVGWSSQVCSWASPAGGGGPGLFRVQGPLLDTPLSGRPHPLAPAARSPAGRPMLYWSATLALAESAEVLAIVTPSSNSGATLVEQDFKDAAAHLGEGIPAALVRAFAEVESGGKSGFNAAKLPVIAFEGHRFRRYTQRKYDKSHPLLSYPYVSKAGPEWKANNKNQTQAWATLRQAMELDIESALKACSWGMFQIMGDNHAACGYKTVRAFVGAMKASERGQLDAFVGFCKQRKGMVEAMRNKDYVAMATKYNGEDYGNYDKLIEKAYKKYSAKE